MLLFVESQVCDSINEVLCSKVKDLDIEACSLILSSLGQKELGRKSISDIKTNVAPLFSERFLHQGSPTLERLNGYYAALAGLKMQSGVAALGLTKKDLEVNRSELKSAQQLMSENIKAVNHIVKIVTELNTTVPELTEQKLKQWLIDNDIYFSHLNTEPTYYACCKEIDGQEYYFITQYFDDGESWGGHSKSIEEVREMQIESIEYKVTLKDLNDTPLMKTLTFPELCGDVYLAEKPIILHIDEAHEIPSKVMEKFMRDNSVPLPIAKEKQVVDELQRMIKRHNVIFLTGQAGIGKTFALSKILPAEFVIDKRTAGLRGQDTSLIKTDLAVPIKASSGLFAVDEAQIMSNQDLITLTELAFEHLATLVIVTQVIDNLPLSDINNVVKRNYGSIANLFIDKNGYPNEAIINGDNRNLTNAKLDLHSPKSSSDSIYKSIEGKVLPYEPSNSEVEWNSMIIAPTSQPKPFIPDSIGEPTKFGYHLHKRMLEIALRKAQNQGKPDKLISEIKALILEAQSKYEKADSTGSFIDDIGDSQLIPQAEILIESLERKL